MAHLASLNIDSVETIESAAVAALRCKFTICHWRILPSPPPPSTRDQTSIVKWSHLCCIPIHVNFYTYNTNIYACAASCGRPECAPANFNKHRTTHDLDMYGFVVRRRSQTKRIVVVVFVVNHASSHIQLASRKVRATSSRELVQVQGRPRFAYRTQQSTHTWTIPLTHYVVSTCDMLMMMVMVMWWLFDDVECVHSRFRYGWMCLRLFVACICMSKSNMFLRLCIRFKYIYIFVYIR